MSSNNIMNQKLKDLTNEFCPSLYDILKGDQKFWDQLTKKFENKLNIATPAVATSGMVKTESSIPVLIGRAKQGESIIISFLKYIDTEVEFLFDSLLPELKQKGKDLFKRLFLEFDLKKMKNPNPTYLNGISEILTANTLIRNGDYRIIDIEPELSNRRTADFKLIKNETSKTCYVEVYNKHIKADNITNLEEFTSIVDEAIKEKHTLKTTGLTANEKANLFFATTLWPDAKIYQYLENYAKSFNLYNLNAFLPTILTQYDSNGVKSFGFGFITNVNPDGSQD